MENVRRYTRYSTQREGQYFLHKGEEKGPACTIIDVCRKGLGMIFHSNEKINVGANLRLEITDPITIDTLTLRGELRWLKDIGGEFVGGIELTSTLSDVSFSMLT